MTDTTSLLALAAICTSRALGPVFPLHHVTGDGCSCGDTHAGTENNIGKHPRTRHGLHDASSDERTIRSWWARWPSANIGLRIIPGRFVLDVDPRNGGDVTLAEYERRYGRLPTTVQAHTGGGGGHYFFKYSGPKLKGSAGRGLDVKQDGGYVLVSPSNHRSGVRYSWIPGRGPGEAEIAEAPHALLTLLSKESLSPRGQAVAVPIRAAGTRYAQKALASAQARVAGAPEGTRNETLNREAYGMGRLISAGALMDGEVQEVLKTAAAEAGLPGPEVERTIANALRAGAAAPRLIRDDARTAALSRENDLAEADAGTVHLTIEEVIAELDAKAKEEPKPTSEQWRGFWRPLFETARLESSDLNQGLDHLVGLGVGAKNPLRREWHQYQAMRAQADRLAKATLRMDEVARDRARVPWDPLDYNGMLTSIEDGMLASSELLRVDRAYVSVLEDALPGTRHMEDDKLPAPKQVLLVPMNRTEMLLRVEKSVCLWKQDGDAALPIPVPEHLPKLMLERLDKRAPAVVGLVQHPLHTSTGRLVHRNGYDQDSGLYLACGDWQFPTIQDAPSQQEAAKAAARIRELLLAETSLRDEKADGAAVIATLLAGLARKATSQGPGVLINATCQGTGKSTLARKIHVILTGRDMAVQQMPSDQTEFKKQLTATLLRSPAMVCFDNVPDGATLNAESIGPLASVMTSSVHEGRLLGVSMDVSAPTNTLWVFTGNSITVGADFVRRFLMIDLLAKEARPEQRRYSNPDPVRYAQMIRTEIVGALLTIQRAWFAAGGPEGDSYGLGPDFDRLVTWPLAYAGEDGLFAKKEALRAQSPEQQAKLALVMAFRELYQDEEHVARDLVTELGVENEKLFHLSPQQQALRDAIESGDRKRVFSSKALGNFLSTLVDVQLEDCSSGHVYVMRVRRPGWKTFYRVEQTAKQ